MLQRRPLANNSTPPGLEVTRRESVGTVAANFEGEFGRGRLEETGRCQLISIAPVAARFGQPQAPSPGLPTGRNGSAQMAPTGTLPVQIVQGLSETLLYTV